MKLSDYVFDFIKKKGAEHVFVLPGGGAMHLVDSLGKSGLNYIPFLHEQGASIAAEAYGQHTNRPGILLVTSGPGATNAITGVTAGWIDSTPMFVISGQAKRSDLVGDRGVRQIGSQEVQIVPMISPITKYAVQVLNPIEIRYQLERAWHEATSGRPGPVWLDIPLDVQGCEVDETLLKGYKPSYKKNSSSILSTAKKTIDLLNCSKKPLFIVGNGIKLSGAEEKLYEFLSIVKIPVQTTWKTIDMFSEEDSLYVGHPGIMGDRGANYILQEADFILSVGSRLDTSITAFNDRHFGMKAKKVVIDIDSKEIERMDMEIESSASCDAGEFLDVLIRLCREDTNERNYCNWIEWCKSIRRKNPVITNEHTTKKGDVCCYNFIDKLCERLREDDVIVPESSGASGEITYQAFRIKKGQKMKNAAGLGSMGFGLPYAIGSCIANNGKRTILINGDGAIQLNIQELETLHRLKLPVKIFIWANEGYASIRSMQRKNFEGRYVASGADSGLTMPDMIKIARAYGYETFEIKENSEVDRILSELLLDDKPLVCVVHVNPEETVSPRVQAHVGKDGNIVSGLLERMWP